MNTVILTGTAMGEAAIPWATLALLAALGLKHGLDPDHIAAVDGMTRARHQGSAYGSARLTGLQFALGHSGTILLAALLFHSQSVSLPVWLDDVGSWISIVFLALLALLNLHHSVSGVQHVHPVGLSHRLIHRLMGRFAHPVLVGFVFAISLDSLAQAALMASKGNEAGGLPMILAMSAVFGLGMVLADTASGLLVHWLVTRSEALARHAGRIMSALIAVLALLVIAASLGKRHYVALEQAWDHWAAWIGLGLTATIVLAYWVLRWLAGRRGWAAPERGAALGWVRQP